MRRDRDRGQSSGEGNCGRKRRRTDTLLSDCIHGLSDEFSSTESYINRSNRSDGSSRSQYVWLMIVDRLRKEVLNARDSHRADRLACSKLVTTAAPSSSSYQCNVCKEQKAMAKTLCTNYLCWKCLCEWHQKGSRKKTCPCCHTIVHRSHINVIDEKDYNNNSNASRTMDKFPLGLIPSSRSLETQPVCTEVITNPLAGFEQVSTALPVANQYPTSSNPSITGDESCSRPLFLDDVSSDIEWLFSGDVSSNAQEFSLSSEKGLNIAGFDSKMIDDESMNILSESNKEAVQTRYTEGEELELDQYPYNSSVVEEIGANQFCAKDGAWYLDYLLDEETWDCSFLDEIGAL